MYNDRYEISRMRQSRMYEMLLKGEFTFSEICEKTGIYSKTAANHLKQMLSNGSVRSENRDGKNYYSSVPGYEYNASAKIYCLEEDSTIILRMKESKDIKPFRDPMLWLMFPGR